MRVLIMDVALVAVLAIVSANPGTSGHTHARDASVLGNLCNYAKVNRTQYHNTVVLRSGPGMRYRSTGNLLPQRVVYVCDEEGDWFKVYFDGLCNRRSTRGLDIRYVTRCRSGWVLRNKIQVISG